MPSTRRGGLIVVEGLDRAGKSTQCDLLCEHLREAGHQVKRMRFPGEKSKLAAAHSALARADPRHDGQTGRLQLASQSMPI